jgi:hypothetical protein
MPAMGVRMVHSNMERLIYQRKAEYRKQDKSNILQTSFQYSGILLDLIC